MMLAWTAFLIYVVATLGLSWLGSRRTHDLRSYALGSGSMSPWVAGLALAASMTSTATFVINPGIVYAYGLSAVLGYGVAAGLGLSVGIVVLSKGFRRFGLDASSLTVPQWIGQRYGDRRLTLFYALVNLLLIAMVVLICYAMAGLLVTTLRLQEVVPSHTFEVALGVVILFVFGYIFFGGTYAHAYTNTAQGLMMVVVAVALLGSGFELLGDGFFERLRALDASLVEVPNPGSLLFRNLFEVFGVNLLIGVALACQPHFLIKSLYVKGDRQVNQYLAIAVVTGLLFNGVLLCGLFARLHADADGVGSVGRALASQGMGIDGVMPVYIVQAFPPTAAVLISIALLAAGMSTLDGILVALSAILANDVVLVLKGKDASDPEAGQLAFRVGRWALVGFGLLAFVLSVMQHRNKELSVALFAQEGVYALLIATFVPVLFGILPIHLPKGVVLGASISALAVHFAFRYLELSVLTGADFTNPGLTATYGLLTSLAVVAGYGGVAWLSRSKA